MKKTGIELITEERREQIEKHGWSLEHDQYYKNGQLVEAAHFCLEQAQIKQGSKDTEQHEWPSGWDQYFEDKIRSKSIIGQLTVAGAFYMAENDRLITTEYQDLIEAIANEIDRIQQTEKANKFGVFASQIKVGLKVDTTDGDDGVIEKITGNKPFPILVKFKNGGAWQDLRHIKKVYE